MRRTGKGMLPAKGAKLDRTLRSRDKIKKRMDILDIIPNTVSLCQARRRRSYRNQSREAPGVNSALKICTHSSIDLTSGSRHGFSTSAVQLKTNFAASGIGKARRLHQSCSLSTLTDSFSRRHSLPPANRLYTITTLTDYYHREYPPVPLIKAGSVQRRSVIPAYKLFVGVECLSLQ